MAVDWRRVRIGDVAEVFDGPHATPKKTSIGPIFLGINTLDHGRLKLSDVEHLSEEDFARWTRRVTPRAGDVVFSYETRLGEAALIPESLRCCLGRRMGLVRARDNALDSRFFLYQYLSPPYQTFLHSRTVHGSTVDRIPLIDFPDFPIALPCIDEQRAIASLLGSIDDKIELNRQMNETLEAMARAIFKDWFVEFGPTRAKAEGRAPYLTPGLWSLFPETLDDEDKPQGWKIDRLGTFTNLQNGYAFKSSDWQEDGVPVVKIGSVKPAVVDLNDVSYISHLLADERSAFRLKIGDILVGLTGYVGEIGRIPPTDNLPMLNQRVARFSGQFSPFVYACVRDPNFKLYAEGKAHGSAQPNVSTRDLLEYPVVNSSSNVLAAYDEIASALFQKSLDNFGEMALLANTRDLLLPKLMSGEIRLREAEKLVEKVA
jgi:type I restriction enzyme S subunit